MSEPDKKETEIKERVSGLVNGHRFEEAKSLLINACNKNESDHELWFLLGAINGQLGHFDAAIQCCKKVISLKQDYFEAYYNLGQSYIRQGRGKEALESFRNTLRLEPHHRQAQADLVTILQHQLFTKHRKTGAGKRKNKVPGNFEAIIKIGNTARERGDMGEALACYHAAEQQMPRQSDVLELLGQTYQDLRKADEAADYFRQLVNLYPDSAYAHFLLGNALKEGMNLSESMAEYEHAIKLKPDFIDALHNLGIAKMQDNEPAKAANIFQQVLDQDENRQDTRSCLLMCLNYYEENSREVFVEHRKWEHYLGNFTPKQPQSSKINTKNTLRIGYVSPDFRAHSVCFFIEPLLQQHDKAAFEVYCYSDVLNPDIVTRRIQPLASSWQDIQHLSDTELARQIRRDKIDILVDLAGHTARNRLAVFAHKPAPVQVTYLGYPNTTGLTTMDYRLTDAWVDPPGETEQLHSETLFRLANGFLCYDPHNDTATENTDPVTGAYTTFGSFNNLAKLSPKVIALWARLLHTVPNAQLLLKTKPLKDPATQEKIYQQFAGHGINRKRVELVGWVTGRDEHLGLYNRVDIALDTFPYNGTTTTCEALWMGVPVITLAGHTHAGRVGVSLLSQVGLTEFIARDADHYIELAAYLASNREQLTQLRSELRSRVAASPLCDASGFARHVEDAYRQMWRNNKQPA